MGYNRGMNLIDRLKYKGDPTANRETSITSPYERIFGNGTNVAVAEEYGGNYQVVLPAGCGDIVYSSREAANFALLEGKMPIYFVPVKHSRNENGTASATFSFAELFDDRKLDLDKKVIQLDDRGSLHAQLANHIKRVVNPGFKVMILLTY